MTNKTLLVLNIPPPYGGGEMQGLLLKNYFEAREKFICFIIEKRKSDKSKQGRFILYNLFNGIKLICNVSLIILRFRPTKIFLNLPKDFLPFIRTSFIILFAYLLNITILGQLSGTSFLFLKDKNSFRYRYCLNVLKKIDSIRVEGNNIRLILKEFNFSNIFAFSNGVRIPEELSVKRSIFFLDRLSLVYVGALSRSKGILNIIRSAKICLDRGLVCEFNLIGEWVNGEEKKECHYIIKKNGLENILKFHGTVDENTKWQIISSNAVLVHPTYWDGLPFAILEAMGLGLPVISTNVGAIPDVIEDNINGIILKQNTPEYLADAIELFYKNRDLIKNISINNIRTYKAKYTESIFLNNFEKWLNTTF